MRPATLSFQSNTCTSEAWFTIIRVCIIRYHCNATIMSTGQGTYLEQPGVCGSASSFDAVEWRRLQEQSQNGMFIMIMSVHGNLPVFQSADLRPYSAAASEHHFIYAKTSPGVKGRCKSAHCDAHTITPYDSAIDSEKNGQPPK